jgi:hypothetical protein
MGQRTVSSIDTLRDQVACVDAQVAQSAARGEFDELTQRLLAQVDGGQMGEGTARKEVYNSLRERSANFTP